MFKCKICDREITGRGKTGKCQKCVRVGTKHSEETKRKMSKVQTGKKLSIETKIKISKATKGRKSSFKGKHHTKNSKEMISKKAKQRYAEGFNNPFSKIKFSGSKNGMYGKSVKDVWIVKYGKEEAEIKWIEVQEKKRIKMLGNKNPMFGKKAARLAGTGKGCYYKNKWMRSTYELRRAKFLDSQNIAWKHEEIRYNLGEHTYTPDFFIYKNNELIRIEEVKGYLSDMDKKKIKLFKEQYPEEASKFVLLFEKDID